VPNDCPGTGSQRFPQARSAIKLRLLRAGQRLVRLEAAGRYRSQMTGEQRWSIAVLHVLAGTGITICAGLC